MTNDILQAAAGAITGFLTGMANAFLRKTLAKTLLKTEKKIAVTFVSLFSLIRLAVIAFIFYAFLLYTTKIFAIGAVAGLVINSIFTTFYYVAKKKEIKKQEKA